MTLFEYIKMAFQQMRANMMRTVLTMLGIVIGIASMIAVISLGDGGSVRIDGELQRLGVNRIWLYTANNKLSQESLITKSDAAAVEKRMQEHTVSMASYRKGTLMTTDGRKQNAEIMGTDEKLLEIEDIRLGRGRFLNEKDTENGKKTIVLGEEIAKELFGGENPISQKVILQGRPFMVVGVEKGGVLFASSASGKCYIPLKTMEAVFNMDTIDEISISVSADNHNESMDSIGKEALNILKTRHFGTGGFKMFNLSNEMETADNILSTFRLVIAAIAAISLLVGGIGIMNILLVGIKERTQEIGIRKALGAAEGQILLQFMIESLAYAVIGGLFGITFGMLASFGFSSIVQVPFIISSKTLLISSLFAIGIGLFFGIYPAGKAAALDPIEALRQE